MAYIKVQSHRTSLPAWVESLWVGVILWVVLENVDRNGNCTALWYSHVTVYYILFYRSYKPKNIKMYALLSGNTTKYGWTLLSYDFCKWTPRSGLGLHRNPLQGTELDVHSIWQNRPTILWCCNKRFRQIFNFFRIERLACFLGFSIFYLWL